MTNKTLIPHLFRSEFSKIVAVLCKTFGLSSIQLAEDVVSDTFLKATETWGLKGIPENPTAWLYRVAKNKAKDHFRRTHVYNHKIVPELKNQSTNFTEPRIDLSKNNIKDSQLQMLFAVCNPIISDAAQLTLALRILCGFGIEEISNALLSNKETINKRLSRAKEKLRREDADLSFPNEVELENRLNNVLHTLYLLFNEGYYSRSSEKTIKKEVCLEAMRLIHMLLDHRSTNTGKTNALMALCCFHSSRLDARINQDGSHIVYHKQNKEKWHEGLIGKGEFYLNLSASGSKVTAYHLEAMIAYWHTRKEEINDKWNHILQLYNQLLQLSYSPITALNRTYALAKVYGKEKAIEEALKIKLSENHLYHSLLAELYSDLDVNKEIEHLQLALQFVTTENEKKFLQTKLDLRLSS